MRTIALIWTALLVSTLIGLPVKAANAPSAMIETPFLAADVGAGKLPPVERRIPNDPSIVDFSGKAMSPGRHGGDMRMLMGRSKDVRQLVVYGYTRLVGYDRKFNIVPDILRKVDIDKGRIFTFYLRKGHKWSDGHPFTSEDFRYYWEDVANNKDMSPAGITRQLMVDGEAPVFEVIDETTIRYSWSKPNPFFLPALARASPLYIYRPAHYMKQFHARYTDPEILKKRVKKARRRNWIALHYRKDRQYKNDNVDLPILQPWVLATPPPSDRFIFNRNPFFHRIDQNGRQLPYIDRVIMSITSSKLISAKTGAGEADLQARSLAFSNYTFLKRGEKRNNYTVHRWQSAKGAHLALFPNLNAKDPQWRALFRKTDFRRALSLAVNRHEINQTIYFGLGLETNNTVLPRSPLYRPEYGNLWAKFDLKRANALLDGMGLSKRNERGIRLLPDGRPMEIIVETAGESTEQTDVLELIHDSWLKAGIKLYSKPLQREVFRNRILTGTTLMSIWFGLENGVATALSSPGELAPTNPLQYQWPLWGRYYETNGKSGEAPDMAIPKQLANLYREWLFSSSIDKKEKIWHKMLKIHADQVYTIGLICSVPQPVVVSNRLMNVPKSGIYNWDPGAHFGIHRPDTFWFTSP